MATPPKLFPEVPNPLSDKQKNMLFNLERSIDSMLQLLDGPGKPCVTLQIHTPPPDSKVLVALGKNYYQKGWKEFVINGGIDIDEEYEREKFWTLHLVKRTLEVPGNPFSQWVKKRGR